MFYRSRFTHSQRSRRLLFKSELCIYTLCDRSLISLSYTSITVQRTRNLIALRIILPLFPPTIFLIILLFRIRSTFVVYSFLEPSLRLCGCIQSPSESAKACIVFISVQSCAENKAFAAVSALYCFVFPFFVSLPSLSTLSDSLDSLKAALPIYFSLVCFSFLVKHTIFVKCVDTLCLSINK